MRFDRARLQRCLIALAVGLAAALLTGGMRSAFGRLFDTDFYVFYESALAWRNGSADLYTTTHDFPNLNPPHFVVAFAPLTLVQPRVALIIWFALNIGAAVCATVLIWRELALPRSFSAIGLAIAFAGLTTGLQFGLEEAQPTGVFALLLTGAWYAARRRHEKLAGVLLGLLVSVKPFFVCVLLVQTLKRQWIVLVWAAMAGVSALIAGLALAGVHSYVRWVEVGRQVSWFIYPLNASIMGVVARAGLAWSAWFAASAIVVVVTVLAVRQSDRADAAWLVSGLASVLISPLGWLYYLPLLAGPLTAVARQRPAILAAGVGFLWPLPLLMMLIPVNTWTVVIVFSIPAWSLLGIWACAVRQSLAPSCLRSL
jgi:alpha-1,2-mannosyltransferase